MKIYIGADHNGYYLKEKIADYLQKRGYDVIDEGDEKLNPEDDFTVFASRVVNAMKADEDESIGVLICGSGQGMAIAANRHKGVRAILGYSKRAALEGRNDEDANVLALPSEILDDDDKSWKDILDSFLTTPFAGAARYKRRNRQLDEL